MSASRADAAVAHILNRIQTDPDLHYYAGPFTETFALLCAAEAERTGLDVEEVTKRRSQDRQPPHRRRVADIVKLKAGEELLRHVRTCDQCRGPNDGCEDGQELEGVALAAGWSW